MNQDSTFSYKYSAKENKEIQEIRNKYLPQGESKLDELKRLDSLVQTSGITEALSAGIGGALIFGVGMCLAMQILGGGAFLTALGVLLGIIGICSMLSAYPVYLKIFGRAKEKYTPKILSLTEELMGENNY